MKKTSIKVGVIGGSGYVGGELLRLLLTHPNIDVTMVTSRKYAGTYVYMIHPNLRSITQLKFVPYDEDQLEENCDLVFTATPHGSSQTMIPQLLKGHLKDQSGFEVIMGMLKFIFLKILLII